MGRCPPPRVATPQVMPIRYILLIFPAVFTAAYNPGSTLTSSRSSRMRLEPVRFLRMAGWKSGIASSPATHTRPLPGSSPDPAPRAGFYYQVIDKPGVRGAGRAPLQPPPAHCMVKHRLHSASLHPPTRKSPPPPVPAPPSPPFSGTLKGLLGALGPGGYSQGLLSACPSC